MKHNYYTLGVDPAKHKVTICLLHGSGREIVSPCDLACTREGFDQLRCLLESHVPAGQPLTIGVECTGSLDDNVLALFASMRDQWQLTLIRVDAAPVHHFSGPRPLRGKSDRADARRIARFTRTYAEELYHFVADEELLAMQRLVNERLALAEDLTQLKNRLHDRLVISFPELTQVFNDPACGVALAVLAKAPTASQVAKMRPSSLAQLRGAGKHGRVVGAERAAQLKALAHNSIASACTASDAATIERLVSRIQMLLEHQDQIEQHLSQFVATAAEPASAEEQSTADAEQPSTRCDLARQIQIAQSLPGLGLVNSSALVLRSRGIRRFTTRKALAAQLGLCPDQNQTGSSRDTSRLTYRGDRRARSLMFLACVIALRTDVAFSFHHWRLVQSGKSGKQAVCACMNRMAQLLWTLVDNNTTYDPQRAIRNAAKHHPELWKSYLEHASELGKTMQKKIVQLNMEARI
jgi:transposase